MAGRWISWRPLGLLLLPLLLWGTTAPAALLAIESGLEMRLNTLRMPERAPAPLRLRPCADCAQLTLELTAATTWYLAGEAAPITQAEWLRAAGDRLAAPLVYVFYRPDTREVTRVILDRAGDGP